MLKRFQNSRLLQVVFFAGVLLFSCTKDFIEPNLDKRTVTLVAPSDGYETTTLTNLFWWDTIKNAANYNLQIASPSFSAIQKLMLDTNLTTNKYSFSLIPGTYEWRVKAFNSSSASQYTTYSLKIDSTASLSGQTLVLVSPTNNLVTQTKTQTLVWNPLAGATEYRFQIINSVSATIFDVTVTADSLKYTFNEGQYTWQVRAQNATSNSLYSSRIITLDSTAPAASIPLLPANADSSHSPVSLSWSRASGGVGDSLFINTDSLFLLPMAYTGYSSATSYSFTTGVIGKKYFWRLKTVDAAGNWSGYGVKQRFKVY